MRPNNCCELTVSIHMHAKRFTERSAHTSIYIDDTTKQLYYIHVCIHWYSVLCVPWIQKLKRGKEKKNNWITHTHWLWLLKCGENVEQQAIECWQPAAKWGGQIVCPIAQTGVYWMWIYLCVSIVLVAFSRFFCWFLHQYERTDCLEMPHNIALLYVHVCWDLGSSYTHTHTRFDVLEGFEINDHLCLALSFCFPEILSISSIQFKSVSINKWVSYCRIDPNIFICVNIYIYVYTSFQFDI